MTINEKSAYIKGLAEGLALDAAKPETKVINALLDLVSDLSAKVSELEEELEVVGAVCNILQECGMDIDKVYERIESMHMAMIADE